jgi:hypothetical protein
VSELKCGGRTTACFDDLEFDLIGEAPLELGHQLRFGPLEDGRGLAKLGSVGSDGARLFEIMEVEVSGIGRGG